jgi:P27 family predicted phage terminase small subunit
VARGNPGRRKKSVKAMIAEADRIATLLAQAPAESGDVMAPPSMLQDPLYAPALRVWRELVPELRRTHRFGLVSRDQFAMFCVYFGEWVAACDDIKQRGIFQLVETVAGGAMERTRPIVAFREIAFGNVRKLSAEFGLTPREEYALFRDQADALTKNPGLFGDERRQGAPQPAAPEQAAEPSSRLIGGLDGFDSPPPDSRVQ